MSIPYNKQSNEKGLNIMMLQDTLGWVRRNVKNMNDFEQKKLLNEISQIKLMLERNLNIKTKGVV